MVIVMRKIAELIPADYNPRYMTDEDEKEITDSLTKFGFVDPVVVNIHPDRKNIIIGGHQRTTVWGKLGKLEVPTVELSLVLADEKELNIRLNKNKGRWNETIMKEHFDKPELLDWGFTKKELSSIFEDVKMDDVQPDESSTQTLLFQTKENREKWDGFLKRIKTKYPDINTISERLIKFIEDNPMKPT